MCSDACGRGVRGHTRRQCDSQARFAPLFPSALVQRVPGSAHDTIPFLADTGHAVVLVLAAVAGVPLRLDALLRGRARFVETRRAMEDARLSLIHI